MSVLLIIPARYASNRFPGKPLANLTGSGGTKKPLIERTWLAAQAVKGVDRVVVATDDERIATASKGFGAEVIMTSSECQNGTERCAEAMLKLDKTPELVVNLQGDAPLTPPWFIQSLLEGMQSTATASVATPILRCDGAAMNALVQDRKAGRVGGTTAVVDHHYLALYFSKEVIPFTKRKFDDHEQSPVFHHVGVYAYRPDALTQYLSWSVGTLEAQEELEQLRFLENGSRILCVPVDARGRLFWELNNPEDVPKIEAMMADMGME
ncbi:MAG: 3-deoxy-manno-octulosonate cytidylyltransferase [Aestuariivita sp.]|nr:3-deoxy-manno-octulosonate cytidylyltransferase [Aestuariivita sp.]MCY4345846.1 3-deoxy-manno-octulosonate cytidylyltransferase [Aestuariivita sp.]